MTPADAVPIALSVLALLAAGAAALLVVIVLLQSPSGGGLTGALGAAGETVLGTAQAPVRRLTTSLASVWLIACAAHALLL